MREIKFRAWNEKEKIMFKVGDDYGTTHPCDPLIYWKEGQEVIPLQYTSLKDSNGTEIYEGDILGADGRWFRPIVGFTEGMFFIKNLCPNISVHTYLNNQHEDFNVIGDIYENPELL